MAIGKKTIKGAEKGDILIAKRTVSAYEKPNDYSSVQLHFLAGQELGTIEDFVLIDTNSILKEKFIIFNSRYDDGFGSMVDSTFSLPESADSLEFKANPNFAYPDIYKDEHPNANQTKKTVEDSATPIAEGWDVSPKNTGIRGASVSKQNDTASSNILGFTPTVFFSGLAGLFILIIGAYLILKSEPASPQQSPQTLSGVENENNKYTIPKMDFIKI